MFEVVKKKVIEVSMGWDFNMFVGGIDFVFVIMLFLILEFFV